MVKLSAIHALKVSIAQATVQFYQLCAPISTIAHWQLLYLSTVLMALTLTRVELV